MSPLSVRVTVLDTWEEFPFSVSPDTEVAALKRQALARARVTDDADGYVVKFRGAQVAEGGHTLADAGVVPNGALIVMPRRRRPVR